MNDNEQLDPRLAAIPDTHGHAKGEHKPYAEERPIPYSARMLFLWFYHAARRGWPRFLMVADHMNYLTFEDPAAVNLVRRALNLAQAGDLYGASETASVDVAHAAVVSQALRRGFRYSIGAEVDNDPRSRQDAQNIVDSMRPDAMIRSVHFLPIDHPVHGAGWNWPFDNPEFVQFFDQVGTEQTWELYMQALLSAIETLPGHIVGHFYVPATFGHWPDDETLERYEDQMLEAASRRGMAVEFNTRFLYRDHPEDQVARYLAANKRLMRKAKERGVPITIGSDAHSPKDQSRGFETVLAILDELDINEIAFPINGRFATVKLRVDVAPEPEPPAPEPEPPAVQPQPEPIAQPDLEPALAAKPPKAPRAPKAAKPPKSAVVVADPPGSVVAEPIPPEPALPPAPVDVALAPPAEELALPPAAPAAPEPAVALDAAVTEPVAALEPAPKPKKAPKAAPPPRPAAKVTAAKPAAKRAQPAKSAKPAAKAAAKATPAKAKASPARKAAAKKVAAKPAARSAAKATAKAKTVKKATPARRAAKKAVTRAAKSTPARKAPARAAKPAAKRVVKTAAKANKSTATRRPPAKKATAKRPAAKRR